MSGQRYGQGWQPPGWGEEQAQGEDVEAPAVDDALGHSERLLLPPEEREAAAAEAQAANPDPPRRQRQTAERCCCGSWTCRIGPFDEVEVP